MISSSGHWSSILHPQLFSQLDLAFGLWQTRSNTGQVPSWPPPHRGLGISTVPHTYLEGATAEEHEQGLVSLHALQEEQGWLPEVIYAGQVTSLGEKGLCKPLVPYMAALPPAYTQPNLDTLPVGSSLPGHNSLGVHLTTGCEPGVPQPQAVWSSHDPTSNPHMIPAHLRASAPTFMRCCSM